jgi:hypothetical protein
VNNHAKEQDDMKAADTEPSTPEMSGTMRRRVDEAEEALKS